MGKHEDHICRFNDGECTCDCYDKGFEAGQAVKFAKTYKSSQSYLRGYADGAEEFNEEIDKS